MTDEQYPAYLHVVIASYDKREISVQKRYLEEQSSYIKCRGCRDGMQLLDELRAGICCDVIVLCGRLEDMDGQEFIERMCRQAHRPPLILFDDTCRCGCAISCMRADGTNYMVKRSDLKELMQELCGMPGRQPLRVEALCGKLYKAWGISCSSVNCGYLTCAVRTACFVSEKLALRKELLNQVSREHNTSVAAVDSGIRRLIDELEERRTEAWQSFKSSSLGGRKPTAGSLIYAIRNELLANGLT